VCRFAAVNRRWRRRFSDARCYARLVLGAGVTDAAFISLVSRAARGLTSVVLCRENQQITDASLHVLHAQTRLVELHLSYNESITAHGIAVALMRRDNVEGVLADMRARTADGHTQLRGCLALAAMGKNVEDAASVAAAGAVGVVIASLAAHPSHASMQQLGFRFLSWLVACRLAEAAAAVQAGVLQVAVAALRTHAANRAVVVHVSRAILALTCGDTDRAALAAAAGAMPALAAALPLVGVRADAASAAAFTALLSLYIACDDGEFTKDAGVMRRTSNALRAVLQTRHVSAAARAALREAGRTTGQALSDTATRAWVELATFGLRACTADVEVQLLIKAAMEPHHGSKLRDAIVQSRLPPEAILDVMRAHPAHAGLLESSTRLLCQRLTHASGGDSDDDGDNAEDRGSKRAVEAAIADGAVQLLLRACDVLSNAVDLSNVVDRPVDLEWCGRVLFMLSHAGSAPRDAILRACMDALRSSEGRHGTRKEQQLYTVLMEIVIRGGGAAADAAAVLGAAVVFVRAMPHAYPMQRGCMALRAMATASGAAKKAVLASGALAVCRAQLAGTPCRSSLGKSGLYTYQKRGVLLAIIHALAPRSLTKEERDMALSWQN
jgi:hypothetical protein